MLLVALAVSLSTPAHSDAGASERTHIVQAQQSLRQHYGGHKLSQTWRNGALLVVWQSAQGERLLVRVDPSTGRYRVLRDESSRR
ncbi:MAG: hypothetical protein ABF296_01990 [Oceanococcaceae bacterium]